MRISIPGVGYDRNVKFIVLDDHELVRNGLQQQLIAVFPGCTILFLGDDVREAVQVARTWGSDCAIVDLDLGDGRSVTDVVGAFTKLDIPVVVVSALAAAGVLESAMAAGARGFVSKRSAVNQLAIAVKHAIDGETFITPDLGQALVNGVMDVELSKQEKRALILYASGLTLEMVARRMAIAPTTVKHYIDRVREKYAASGLNARTKIELATVARSQGLIPS